MNMPNITFKVSFVFKKSSKKNIFTIIFVVKSLKGFGWNIVISLYYFTIGAMYLVIRVLAFREIKSHPYGKQSKTWDNHPILFQCWASVEYY